MNNGKWWDVSWNPVTGCTKCSPGCLNCYAERISKRFHGPDGFRVTYHPERLRHPLKFRKPKRIFVCDMGDLFHDSVDYDTIISVLNVVFMASVAHDIFILTKRSERMRLIFSQIGYDPRVVYSNIYLGVTVENQEMADLRIHHLLTIQGGYRRFISIEPMLGPVELSYQSLIGLDWVVLGGESGPGARPMHPDWVRSVRDQCQAAQVPFWFKSWGEWCPDCIHDSKDPCRTIERPSPGHRGCMFRCGKKSDIRRKIDWREWNER